MTTTRLSGLYAMLAAAAAVAFGPLLALSYFGIDEGSEELSIGTVSAWADPARDLAGGLLTWASPERVYATYVQVFALLFPAVLLCALATRAQRHAGERSPRASGLADRAHGLCARDRRPARRLHHPLRRLHGRRNPQRRLPRADDARDAAQRARLDRARHRAPS